jgi:hypothetical protein
VSTSDLVAGPTSITTGVSNAQAVSAHGLNVFWANHEDKYDRVRLN